MKIIAIGGGELRTKETLAIDKYIAQLGAARAAQNGLRGYALFVPTASHDSKPYFNTFRKTYTSECGLKVDVAISTRMEMTKARIREKIALADIIYVGGGDTLFMLDEWSRSGLGADIIEAGERGVILSGLSAGAICWFDKCYSDTDIINGGEGYRVIDGLGVLKGLCCPHFDERREDFLAAFSEGGYEMAYCIENNCALEFTDGKLTNVLTSGGKAYLLTKEGLEELTN